LLATNLFFKGVMVKNIRNAFFITIFGLSNLVYAAPLISAQEAALPATSGTLATRGISRGPGVKLASPEADTPTAAPFDLKINFEARGDTKIDPNSVKVTYMKSPPVDLTSRLKKSISASGIDLNKAEVPPGTHTIRVSVKDTEGRETNSVVNLVVTK
jgi:hypothetical protein